MKSDKWVALLQVVTFFVSNLTNTWAGGWNLEHYGQSRRRRPCRRKALPPGSGARAALTDTNLLSLLSGSGFSLTAAPSGSLLLLTCLWHLLDSLLMTVVNLLLTS